MTFVTKVFSKRKHEHSLFISSWMNKSIQLWHLWWKVSLKGYLITTNSISLWKDICYQFMKEMRHSNVKHVTKVFQKKSYYEGTYNINPWGNKIVQMWNMWQKRLSKNCDESHMESKLLLSKITSHIVMNPIWNLNCYLVKLSATLWWIKYGI